MPLISYDPLDVIYRNLDDTIIIKNIRCNEMMTLKNVSADIWLYLAHHKCIELNDVISYITKEYDTEQSEIENDITDFLEELYYSGVIMINDNYYSNDSEPEETDTGKLEDYENKIILLFEEYNIPYSVTDICLQ